MFPEREGLASISRRLRFAMTRLSSSRSGSPEARLVNFQFTIGAAG